MAMGVLDQVRDGCRQVAERARHVTLHRERIPAYAASLLLERIEFPEHHPEYHYLGHGDDTVAFFLTLDSINFGSGFFPFLRKRDNLSGYFTVAAALNDHFRQHGPISPQELVGMSVDDCARIFDQDLSVAPVRELMGLFATALNDLGRFVTERFNGSFSAVVASAGGSVERLVEIMAQMPFYRDVEKYDDLEVPFYKRAQIISADLHIAFNGTGPGRFDDFDRLTIFADNLVPHVLMVDGILSYDPALAARIQAEEPIPLGSPEEVEIRACAVHAVEMMVEELRRRGGQVTSMGIDNLLWHRGQGKAYKSRPRHRTRCVYY